jgi:hypothetical protein
MDGQMLNDDPRPRGLVEDVGLGHAKDARAGTTKRTEGSQDGRAIRDGGLLHVLNVPLGDARSGSLCPTVNRSPLIRLAGRPGGGAATNVSDGVTALSAICHRETRY